MPKIIAVANLKGGCGKSTIAIHLAGELTAKNTRVELVDADEQGTATAWAEAGKLPFRVDCLPLEGRKDMYGWSQRALSLNADVVVIDCPPHLSYATKAAVMVSDLVLVPIFSSAADLRATVRALALIREARSERDGTTPACLVVPSRIDRRTLAGREVESALKQFGEPIGPAVAQRSAFIDACSLGLTIGDYAPDSPAHDDIKALSRAVKRRLL